MKRHLTFLFVMAALSVHGSELQDPSGTQLRLGGSVTVEAVPDLFVKTRGGSRTFLFVGSWRCDHLGNVYFVPATPETLDHLDRIVQISPKGTLLTLLPRSGTNDSPLKPAVRSRSIGPSGRLHVLIQTEQSGSLRQRIVSFTPTGEETPPQGAIQLDTLQIVAEHFAVVGTGDVVVLGFHPQNRGERLALVSQKGQVLRDVGAPEGIIDTSSPSPLTGFTWLGAGSDGLAYLVRERARRILAISSAGEVVRTFDLLGPAAMRLTEVHLSAGRLAAIYRPHDGGPRWIQVQDLATGDLIHTYGPVANPVVCYQRGERDWFTLLSTAGGVWRLTRAEIP